MNFGGWKKFGRQWRPSFLEENSRREITAQVTVIVSSPTMVEPSSSVQVSTTGPDSVALNLNWM